MADGYQHGHPVAPYCPDCHFCREDLSIARPAAHWCMPGSWMYVPDMDRFMFVLHPSVGRLEVFDLPNGQQAFGSPPRSQDPSIHVHEACLRHGVLQDDEDDDDEDIDTAEDPIDYEDH